MMLITHQYAKAVDIWSAGCSFAEVMNGKILFPGQHYIEQINLIINLRGSPNAKTKEQISNEYALKYIESLPQKEKVALDELFPGYPKEALDLLDKMLDLDPTARIKVEEALEHPFL